MSGGGPAGPPGAGGLASGGPQLDPTIQEAEIALTSGRLERAESLFLERLATEPADVLAIVGLAEVALERGDDRRACEIARWALHLDPRDDLAGRLVSRLEEVMRYRGETPPPAADTPPRGIPVPSTPTGGAATQRQGRRMLDRLAGRSRPAHREEP